MGAFASEQTAIKEPPSLVSAVFAVDIFSRREACSKNRRDMSYEERRAENIKRNEEYLSKLGLIEASAIIKKKARVAPKSSKEKMPQVTNLRRSERVLGLPAVSYYDPPIPREAARRDGSRRRSAKGTCANVSEQSSGMQEHPIPMCDVERAAPASSLSCRALDADIEKMYRLYLGTYIPALGGTQKKAGVMAEASANGRLPRFSKMSGIQEWNNCVMLFVNVPTPIEEGCDGLYYDNVFKLDSDGELTLTWFAQSRQSDETPVVQRLLRAPRSRAQQEMGVKAEGQVLPQCASTEETGSGVGSATPPPPPTSVLLLCRNPGGQYVYCGRLAYIEHDHSARPMCFRWKLLDWNRHKGAKGDTPCLSESEVFLENLVGPLGTPPSPSSQRK